MDRDELQLKQRQMNPVTLKQLAANGAILSRPHDLVNVFYVYSSGEVDQLKRRLREFGFDHVESDVVRENDAEYWEVEGTRRGTPTVQSLDSMTDLAIDLVAGLDAEYDGWYTQPVSADE